MSTSSRESTPWTADGRSLILELTNENASNIAVFSEDQEDAHILLETPAVERTPVLSPNSRWLAYASDEAGEFQIFVREYPDPGGK